MSERRNQIHPIGRVESPLTEREAAPRQGDEGAPDAWLALDPAVAVGIRDFDVNDEIVVLTWLDRARRDTLEVYLRGDRHRAIRGVFSTRSPDRPNPIGLHRVRIVAIDGNRIHVHALEAIDGTPIVDIKPVLGPVDER